MIHPFVSASWFIYEYIICSVLLYDDITRFISLQFDYGILKIHLVFMFDSDDISLDGLEQELEECKNDDVRSFPLKIHSFRYIFFINAPLSCNSLFILFLLLFLVHFYCVLLCKLFFIAYKKKMLSCLFLEVYILMTPPRLFNNVGSCKHTIWRYKIKGVYKGGWEQFTESWIGLDSGLCLVNEILFCQSIVL